MILVDTHAWVWLASRPAGLSARARRALADADEIAVSAMSCWEVAMLVAKARLRLDRDVSRWVADALELPRVILAPLSPEIAVRSSRLPEGIHGDPVDRILAATALELDVALVTKDAKLRRYQAIRTVW